MAGMLRRPFLFVARLLIKPRRANRAWEREELQRHLRKDPSYYAWLKGLGVDLDP